MAISTTTDFNPTIDEVFEEAFELCGIASMSGNDVRTARRSLNYLILEWANEGINLWTVDEQTISSSTIVSGTATYNIDIDTIGILDAVIRTDDADTSLQTDLTIQRISQPTYSQIPKKLTTGRPVQFYFNRIGIKDTTATGTDTAPTVTFWPVPDESNKYTFVYWRLRRMKDAGASLNTHLEVPDRFHSALLYGLAAKIAYKKAPQRAQALEGKAAAMFMKAADEDRDRATLRIVPDLSSYGR